MREVRERVALRFAAFVGHGFVAAGERDWLERHHRDLVRVVERELNDAAHLLVVDPVDDSRDQHDFDAVGVQVFDGPQLHVEQIPDVAMGIRGVADAVELEIGVAQPSFRGLPRELRALGELDAVGSRLHAVVAELAGIANGVQKIGRHGRLATGELHRHLAPRLDGKRVVEQRLDVVPGKFVHEADLVGVHEAGIAHHVAAVGQVDGEDRSSPVLDGAAAVVVQLFVVMSADVAARKRSPPDAGRTAGRSR